MTGINFNRGSWFFLSLLGAALLFLHQQYLIRHRERDGCFRAFLNNHYVGAIIFIGLAADYHLTAD